MTSSKACYIWSAFKNFPNAREIFNIFPKNSLRGCSPEINRQFSHLKAIWITYTPWDLLLSVGCSVLSFVRHDFLTSLNLIDDYFTSGKILGIFPEVASVLPCRHKRFRILFKSCDATKKTKKWAQRTSEWNKWIKIFETLSMVWYILRFFLIDRYIPKIESERLKVLHYDLKSFDQSETRTIVQSKSQFEWNLTSREALTVLSSVVKHVGSG